MNVANDLNPPVAISFGYDDGKLCALFFDRVIMLTASDQATIEIQTATGQVRKENWTV